MPHNTSPQLDQVRQRLAKIEEELETGFKKLDVPRLMLSEKDLSCLPPSTSEENLGYWHKKELLLREEKNLLLRKELMLMGRESVEDLKGQSDAGRKHPREENSTPATTQTPAEGPSRPSQGGPSGSQEKRLKSEPAPLQPMKQSPLKLVQVSIGGVTMGALMKSGVRECTISRHAFSKIQLQYPLKGDAGGSTCTSSMLGECRALGYLADVRVHVRGFTYTIPKLYCAEVDLWEGAVDLVLGLEFFELARVKCTCDPGGFHWTFMSHKSGKSLEIKPEDQLELKYKGMIV